MHVARYARVSGLVTVRVVVFAVSVNTIQLNVVLRELNKCALLGCCI